MKKLKSILALMLIIALALTMSVITVGADSAALDTSSKISFTVACDKPHYEFTVYKVGDLKKYNPSAENKYEIVYESSVSEVSNQIINGDSSALLAALDRLDSTGTTVGTYAVDTDGKTKTFNNLDQGIYYVKATNFPAGVKSVTNSVFALPYYSDGWVYSIDTIALAAKVEDGEPAIVKTITNSTKNNPNYTNVSLKDTVEYEIVTDTVGAYSDDVKNGFTLGSYVITDKMSKGLTLNQNSFTVKLFDENGTVVKTLTAGTDYTTQITASEGEDTNFSISITAEELSKPDFYAAKKVSVTYSAVLNKYAVIGKVGNPNEAVDLTYSNKNGVSSTIKGNTVYVYTYAARVNKYDESGSALAGAEFALFKSEHDTNDNNKAIATGTSGKDGIVKFYNTDKAEMSLASGTYYIKETSAPSGYNRYTNDNLPVKRNKNKNKRYKRIAPNRAPRGKSIEKRPDEIDSRLSFGNWEMDCVVGAQGTKKVLLVLTERKTRMEIIRLMKDKTAKSVVRTLDGIERKMGSVMFSKVFQSITVDNGTEFSDYLGIERSCLRAKLRTNLYYCHPYSSYERGSNENQNKMIRRHYPKGFDFSKVKPKDIQRLEDWINNYPREMFDYYSSNDLYEACINSLLTA